MFVVSGVFIVRDDADVFRCARQKVSIIYNLIQLAIDSDEELHQAVEEIDELVRRTVYCNELCDSRRELVHVGARDFARSLVVC